MRPRRDRDEAGFTLIEAVISIMVISIAVVALVGGLVTLIQLTQNHRGHAAVETATKSFAQAVQATGQAPARLSASVTAAATSITVSDATTLPNAGPNAYLLLDREIVRLTAVDRTTGVLTVVRGQGGTFAVAHPATSSVVPHLRCPRPAYLTPWTGAYQVATGVTPTISDVEFINPSTGVFTSTGASSCLADYGTNCPSSTLLPECGTRVFRVVIGVTSTGDSRLRNVSASTQVLVRRGSA
jgi:type II secretory pathway pseudopilin PulG